MQLRNSRSAIFARVYVIQSHIRLYAHHAQYSFVLERAPGRDTLISCWLGRCNRGLGRHFPFEPATSDLHHSNPKVWLLIARAQREQRPFSLLLCCIRYRLQLDPNPFRACVTLVRLDAGYARLVPQQNDWTLCYFPPSISRRLHGIIVRFSSRGYRSPCCCIARHLLKIVHDVEAHRRETIEVAITVHLGTLVTTDTTL